MNILFGFYLIVQSLACMTGFIWTSMDRNCPKQYKMISSINYKMPATYVFPGFIVGFYSSKFLFTSFE